MSGTSAIEWTEATWNPIVGCTHVSEGCDHCYAAREASGRLRTQPAYAGLAVDGRFTGEVRLLPERLDQPLRWRKPRRVFVNSMSDLFHQDVPDEFIAEVFQMMAAAPQHTFQVLTKRPGRMATLVPRLPDLINGNDLALIEERARVTAWPLPNVWLGTSVETQKWADVRIPKLLETPAAVRFLSCEPLLGPVDLEAFVLHPGCRPCSLWRDAGASGPRPCADHSPPPLHWVIAGGESGPAARPMQPDWARTLRTQAVAAGVAFFFKQWGEWAPAADLDPDLRERAPEQLVGQEYVCRVGKKAAGRELDGRTWDEYPAVTP